MKHWHLKPDSVIRQTGTVKAVVLVLQTQALYVVRV